MRKYLSCLLLFKLEIVFQQTDKSDVYTLVVFFQPRDAVGKEAGIV